MLKRRNLLFLDPNINSNKRYAQSLYEALIPLDIKWVGLSSIDIAEHDELFQLMVKSGCEGLLVGFESFNQENMTTSRKGFANVSHYKAAVNKFHNHNIAILGCFVLGFDNDTKETLSMLPDIVDDLGIDLPRYAVLTPFPGTDLYIRLDSEHRIINKNWDLYDTDHVVFEPSQMSPSELQQLLRSAWEKSYSIGHIFKRVMRTHHHFGLRLLANINFRYYSKKLNRLVVQ